MSACGTKQTCQLALTNVRFWGQSGLDQPPLTNLDLEYTANAPVENDIRVKTTAT